MARWRDLQGRQSEPGNPDDALLKGEAAAQAALFDRRAQLTAELLIRTVNEDAGPNIGRLV